MLLGGQILLHCYASIYYLIYSVNIWKDYGLTEELT